MKSQESVEELRERLKQREHVMANLVAEYERVDAAMQRQAERIAEVRAQIADAEREDRRPKTVEEVRAWVEAEWEEAIGHGDFLDQTVHLAENAVVRTLDRVLGYIDGKDL